MLNRRKYSDKELNKILSKENIIILVDSREKANSHILDVFDKEGIQYRVTALESGDYTFELKAIPELDIPHNMDFRQDVMIERKNSLDEISGNFTRGRERFNDEFGRAWAVKKYLLIEDGSYEKILNHDDTICISVSPLKKHLQFLSITFANMHFVRFLNKFQTQNQK